VYLRYGPLCALLRTIGGKLGKPVLMTPEGGSQEHPVLGYEPALGKVTPRLTGGTGKRTMTRTRAAGGRPLVGCPPAAQVRQSAVKYSGPAVKRALKYRDLL
jgi:hypothetical protein